MTEVGPVPESVGDPLASVICCSSKGNSVAILANFRCCLCHFEQFSPLEHLCGLGNSCSMATIDADSAGEMISSVRRALRA